MIGNRLTARHARFERARVGARRAAVMQDDGASDHAPPAAYGAVDRLFKVAPLNGAETPSKQATRGVSSFGNDDFHSGRGMGRCPATYHTVASVAALVVCAVIGFSAVAVLRTGGFSPGFSPATLGDPRPAPVAFRAFVPLFQIEGMDPRPVASGGKGLKNDGMFDVFKIALASSRHLDAPVDVVTTGDDAKIRAMFADETQFGHLNFVNIAVCGDARSEALATFQCPVSFVDTVDQLKVAYLAAHVGRASSSGLHRP